MAPDSNKSPKGELLKRREINRRQQVIRYIERPSGPAVTWLKFIAVMLAASLLMWQLVERIQGYIKNPVIVTRQINYLSQIPFPGLIVCNRQPLRYSYLKNSTMRRVIDHYVSSSDASGRMKESDGLGYYVGRVNEVDVGQFYVDSSQPVQDFIIDCSWHDADVSECSHADFIMVNTDIGVCFRLNFTDQWPNMTAAGPAAAFRVILNVDSLDTFKTSSYKSLGAQVALFPPKDPTPLLSDISFSIPLGFEVNLAIRSEYIERLPKSKKGQCDPKAKVVLFDRYTTAGCRAEEKFMRAVNACSCLPYNFPTYRNDDDELNMTEYLTLYPPCNIQQEYSCVDVVWADTSVRNISCPDACAYHRYSKSISYATISGDQLIQSIGNDKRMAIERNFVRAIRARHNNETWTGAPGEQYYRENFVIINIYFQELLHETVIQRLTYEGLDYAVDIAATVGIILGFLLSTLGEVVANCIWLSHIVRRKEGAYEYATEEHYESDFQAGNVEQSLGMTDGAYTTS